MKSIHFVLLLLLSAFLVSCQTNNPGIPRPTTSAGLRSLIGKHVQLNAEMWVVPHSRDEKVHHKWIGYTGLSHWLTPRYASTGFGGPDIEVEPDKRIDWAWTGKKARLRILDVRELNVLSPDIWIDVYFEVPGKNGPVKASLLIVPNNPAKEMGIETAGLTGTQVAEKVLLRRDNVLWRRLD